MPIKPFVFMSPFGPTIIKAPAALKRMECKQESCMNLATHLWQLEGRLAELPLCGIDWQRMLSKAAPLPWHDLY